mmetsp:Transcript_12820/g.37211  ORF Transcript_12820/g.37211 Transcript_12820/m.37211 type:complete len:204 (+) Transcript_12820:837-1448(+)
MGMHVRDAQDDLCKYISSAPLTKSSSVLGPAVVQVHEEVAAGKVVGNQVHRGGVLEGSLALMQKRGGWDLQHGHDFVVDPTLVPQWVGTRGLRHDLHRGNLVRSHVLDQEDHGEATAADPVDDGIFCPWVGPAGFVVEGRPRRLFLLPLLLLLLLLLLLVLLLLLLLAGNTELRGLTAALHLLTCAAAVVEFSPTLLLRHWEQ